MTQSIKDATAPLYFNHDAYTLPEKSLPLDLKNAAAVYKALAPVYDEWRARVLKNRSTSDACDYVSHKYDLGKKGITFMLEPDSLVWKNKYGCPGCTCEDTDQEGCPEHGGLYYLEIQPTDTDYREALKELEMIFTVTFGKSFINEFIQPEDGGTDDGRNYVRIDLRDLSQEIKPRQHN
jgi:hypothetical protein